MKRSELIDKIHDMMPNRSKIEILDMMETLFSEIEQSISDGKQVRLRGVGSFYTKKYNYRTVLDPRTSLRHIKQDAIVPKFKAGKELVDKKWPTNQRI